MRRIFWHIDALDFSIYSYGFMIMTGFMLAIWMAARRSRVVGIDPQVSIDLTFFLVVAGIVGARVMFVLHFWENMWRPERSVGANLVELINIRNGGLEFYGGLLLAIPVGIFTLVRKRIHLPTYIDLALPSVALGLVFGRMGCFLNGCCWGRILADDSFCPGVCYPRYEADGLPSIPYWHHLEKGLVPNEGGSLSLFTAPLVPAQLIASAGNLALFLVLSWLWARAYAPVRRAGARIPRAGEVGAWFSLLYGSWRFTLEFFRQDTDPVVLASVRILGKYGLTISQVISIGFMTLGVLFLVLLIRRGRGRPIELVPSAA